MKQLPIAIQGFEGSFHQQVARYYYGNNVPLYFCSTFAESAKAGANSHQTQGCIMAIENSIAGSILPNYRLIQEHNLEVVGELYLQIRQHLLVNKGVPLEDITEVHSHPIALQQCSEFLDKYPWKLVETSDTGRSAYNISHSKSTTTAAIAGITAAEYFDLEIRVPNVHTLAINHTRFLILQPHQGTQNITEKHNKASLHFHTDHSEGSLAKILNAIAQKQINISKLQSFPLPNTLFKYQFHLDLEFSNPENFTNCITEIQKLTLNLHLLGIYTQGQWI